MLLVYGYAQGFKKWISWKFLKEKKERTVEAQMGE